MGTISKRKQEHIEIVLKKNVQYSKKAGFEQIMLVHNALPEIDFGKINSKINFLGKEISAPLIIEAMTGGYVQGGKINKKLAEAAEKNKIAFGIGSQRAMIEEPSLKDTYYVRDVAPSIPIIANIGACQITKYSFEKIERIVSSVEADGLAIHLNPLQEVIQHEGDHDFSGIFNSIEKICAKLSVPVIVKETGAGIGSDAAKKLKNAGVAYLDVAGTGGTSWSAIEYERGKGVPGFSEWGIPTVPCIIANKGILPLIASGGVRNGIDVAKAIVLGADLAGAAQPFMHSYEKGTIENEIRLWKNQLLITMFLLGAEDISRLKKAKVFVPQEIKEMAVQI